jgi:hypothetical protein
MASARILKIHGFGRSQKILEDPWRSSKSI